MYVNSPAAPVEIIFPYNRKQIIPAEDFILVLKKKFKEFKFFKGQLYWFLVDGQLILVQVQYKIIYHNAVFGGKNFPF